MGKYNEEADEYEMDEFEKEFLAACEAANAEIQNKLHEAQKIIQECVSLAEERGIAFHAHFVGANNEYIAKSMRDKWPNVDFDNEEFVELGAWEYPISSEYGTAGWQRSYC